MFGFTRVRGRARQLAVVAAALGAFAALPSVASAATCDYDGSQGTLPDTALVDSGGFSWDINSSEAAADDGYHNDSGRSDAFDTMGQLFVSTDSGTTFHEYANADNAGCATEDGDRQVAYPDDTTTVPGLTMGRKVYVPSTGLAFARWLDTLTNTSGSPMTFIMRFGGNLGSDSNTTVAATSNGDQSVTEADSWSDTYEDPLGSGSDPLVTFAWDGTSQPALRAAKAGRFDPSSSGYSETSTSDYLTAEYAVTLAPGETKRFVHFIAMRLSAQDQTAASAAIAAEPTDLDAGLSAAERDSIQNWTFDADHDGVHNALDNCPTVANAGQENIDGDSQGDACDDDIDGDGLSNAIEATLRTDPRKVDTDGDGKNDPADSCPTIAAATDTGCPAPVVIPPSDKTAPVITIGGTSKVSLKTLLTKGLKVTVSSNEPTSFSFQIVGAAKGAKLSKVGDLIVATKSLAAGNGKRTVTITIAKKWRKAIGRKSKLTLQTVGTDASGNRTAKSSKLKLTK